MAIVLQAAPPATSVLHFPGVKIASPRMTGGASLVMTYLVRLSNSTLVLSPQRISLILTLLQLSLTLYLLPLTDSCSLSYGHVLCFSFLQQNSLPTLTA